MVSTKIQNNKTSANAVPSAEWNWLGDLFNSTTQNTTFTIGTGTLTSGAIISSGTVRTSLAVESDEVRPNTSTAGISLENKNGVTILQIGAGSASSTSATFTGTLAVSGTISGANISSATLHSPNFRNLTISSGTFSSVTITSASIGSSTLSSPTVLGQLTAQTIEVANYPITGVKFAEFDTLYSAGTSGTAKTIDWNNGANQRLTLTGNVTLSFVAPSGATGPTVLRLRTHQDGTGGRTITWPSSVFHSGSTAPTITSTANRGDWFTLLYYSGTYDCVASLNFQ